MNNSEDEIDLLVLFQKIRVAIARNKVLFVVIVITGLVGGAAFFQATPSRFKARMLADTRVLTNREVMEMTDNLQTLVKDHDFTLLAAKLHLSPAVVGKIITLSAEGSAELPSAPGKNVFVLQATVYDPHIIDSLQQGIVYFLENNEYVRQRIRVQRENLTAIKIRSEKELAQLDSLKASMLNLVRRGGNAGNAFVLEPGSINEQSVKMFEKIRNLDESLQFLDNVQVISNFDKPEKADFPKLSVCLIAGLILGLIIALAVVLLKETTVPTV